MQPRLSIVTLGVADVGRARRFYEALGFIASKASTGDVAFFDAGGVVLALYGRAALAEDAHVADVLHGGGNSAGSDSSSRGPGGGPADAPPAFSGVTLARNVASEAEVDAVLADAVAKGARLLKPAQKVFWGGYSGYFADPDGHLWEVAHNPFFPLDAAGRLQLP